MFSDTMLTILPRESRAKLENLLIEKQAARAAFIAASDALQTARQDYGLAQGRARERMAMPAGYEMNQHPAAAVARESRADKREREETEARLQAPVEAAKRRLDLASEAYERAGSRQSAFAFLEGVQQWLQRAQAFGGMALCHHAPQPPKVRDVMAEIAKLRSELQTLDAQWSAAEDAPLPASILRQQAVAEIDAVAAAGALSIDAANRSGEPLGLRRAIRIGQSAVALPGEDRPFMALEGNAGGPLMVWLHRDVFVEHVEQMVAALPQEGALDDDARDQRFSEISAKRLEIERAEEALICAAEQDGRTIQRRRDADPRAILEIVET